MAAGDDSHDFTMDGEAEGADLFEDDSELETPVP